jgi:hypothetical protein
MGCQTEVEIEKNCTFSICCHDPDTGVLTDADVAPSYRVYEDETVVPILTGNMALLDAVNTTGFYTEQIACTAANGFEVDKSYTIYIEATVDGDTGGISYGLLIKADAKEDVVDALTVDVIADSVSADGSRPTIAQALLEINRFLQERSVVGTVVTVTKEDGSTEAMVFTLDDATAPTSISRST